MNFKVSSNEPFLVTREADQKSVDVLNLKTSDLTNDSNYATISLAEDVVLGKLVTSSSGMLNSEKFYKFLGTYSTKTGEIIETPDFSSTQETPNASKIYVDITTNTSYKYDGSKHVVSNRFSQLDVTDLSNYYTKTEVDTALGGKADSADLASVATSGSYNDLSNKPTIPTVPTNVSSFANDAGYITSFTETDPTVPSYVKSITQQNITDWNNKQDALTFDSTPTANSNNVVKSGGVYTAIQDAIEFYKIPSADVTAILAAGMYHVVQDQTILNTACEAILTALKNNKRITWDYIDGYDVTNFVIVRSEYVEPSDDDKTVQLFCVYGSSSFAEMILTKSYSTSNWSASMGGQSLVPSVQGDGNAITGVNTTDGQFILNKDKTFLESETDPVFTASAAHGITSSDITNWNNKLDSYTETDPTVPSWAKASSKPTYTASEVGALPSTTQIPTNTSDLVNDSGFVDKQIYLGTSPASDAASYNKTATVETFPTEVVTIEGSNVTQPKVGIIIGVKYLATNTYKTSGSTYTLNVNNLGAYPMYYNNAALATSTSPNTLVAGYLNRYIYYIFNGTQWVWLTASYDSNTTYSNVSLGQGYTGNCTTAAATVAKTAALSSYALTTGGIVVVTFTNGNTAKSPTLNINSKGAKAIYFRGAACPTDLIQAGDRVTMIYSSQYHIVSIARRNGNVLTADASANTIALKDNNTTLSTIDIKSINGVSLLGQGDLTVVGSNQPTSVVTVNGGAVTQAMDANVLYIIGSSATPCTSLTFTLNAGGSNTTNYYHAIVTCAANMTFTKPSTVKMGNGREIPSFTAGSIFEFDIIENIMYFGYTEV